MSHVLCTMYPEVVHGVPITLGVTFDWGRLFALHTPFEHTCTKKAPRLPPPPEKNLVLHCCSHPPSCKTRHTEHILWTTCAKVYIHFQKSKKV